MTAKVNISFFGILSITRFSNNFAGNVPYPECVKKWIKCKKAYCSEVQINEYDDDIPSYSRKVCIMLTLEELKELRDEIWFNESNNTMGSLTLEYGLIEAVSLSTMEYDRDTSIDYNLYLSVIPNCSPENWEKLLEMWEFKQFFNTWRDYLNESILEYLDEQRDDLPELEKEFILNQLTLQL